MFVDEGSGCFFFCGCLNIDLAVQGIWGIRFKGDDVVLFSARGKMFGCVFVKHSGMLVVMEGNGWVNLRDTSSAKVSLLNLMAGRFNVKFVPSQDVFQPVNCWVEPVEPRVS